MNNKLEKKRKKIAEPSDFCTALDDDKEGLSSSSANNLLSSVKIFFFFSQKKWLLETFFIKLEFLTHRITF